MITRQHLLAFVAPFLVVALNSLLIEPIAAGCLSDLFCSGPDAITLLNDKLVDLTDSMDLDANVEVANLYKRTPEFKLIENEQFKLAISLFSQLNAEDECDLNNFDLMRQLFELASRKNLEDIRLTGARRRLIRLLHNIRNEFKFKCLPELDKFWSKKRGRTDYFQENMVQLMQLGPLLESHAEKAILQQNVEVKQLNGAKVLLKRRKSVKDAADLFNGGEIKEVLMSVNKLLTGFRALKVNEKTGAALKLDLESADRPLQVYLLEPCRKLVASEPEVGSLLKPIEDIASIILVDDLVRPISYPSWRMYSVEWASYYGVCKLLLEADAKQLAAKVAKARQMS